MKLLFSAFHSTFDRRFLKFATNFNFIMQLSIKSRNLNQSSKFHAESRWEDKLPGSLRRKFTLFGNTVGLVIIFKLNPFTVQGKAIPSSVRENIIEIWFPGSG